jgi:hypothetical protein
MLNARMVNARISCTTRAHFCESFLVLGRFLLFKKPLKYTAIFDINQNKGPAAADRHERRRRFSFRFNALRRDSA